MDPEVRLRRALRAEEAVLEGVWEGASPIPPQCTPAWVSLPYLIDVKIRNVVRVVGRLLLSLPSLVWNCLVPHEPTHDPA